MRNKQRQMMTSTCLDWRAAPRAPGRDGLSNLRKVSLSLNFRTGSDLGRQSTWSKSPILQVRNVKFKGALPGSYSQ